MAYLLGAGIGFVVALHGIRHEWSFWKIMGVTALISGPAGFLLGVIQYVSK